MKNKLICKCQNSGKLNYNCGDNDNNKKTT